MISKKVFEEEKCWRIIPSRYPPMDLFERVVESEDLDLILELESLTNDRLRNEVGNLSLVPLEDRISGPNTSYIMAAFTHLNPHGSRFSDGTWGVYYAGLTIDTEISETTYHREKFLKFTDEEPIHIDMRVITAKLNSNLEDVTTPEHIDTSIYHLDHYNDSQAFARSLREKESNGIFYKSVRHEIGKNIAIFKPKCLSNCLQEQHLEYVWNGSRITDVFEKKLFKK
mgnify:CR=1 FL=1